MTSLESLKIGEELGLGNKDLTDIVLAGILHDIGLFSVREKEEVLKFIGEDLQAHGEKGYQLLKTYSPLADVADIVRFHHVFWDGGKGKVSRGIQVPLASHILHLADRISILADKDDKTSCQVDSVYEAVYQQVDYMFKPELVKAFDKIRQKESFWLDFKSNSLTSILSNAVNDDMIHLGINGLTELSQLFSKIIDFRSPFTATHSSGLAVTSTFLAEKIGFSENQCKMMTVAGNLHDLGKLAIPVEILEKKGSLTPYEFSIMKSHVYYTYRTLEAIKELNTINLWASLHHERLNGRGYPFKLSAKEIPLGSRIMAVADVFTAVTEDRPYRAGMDIAKALKILEDMVVSQALDPMVVSLLEKNIDEINRVRIQAQKTAKTQYGLMDF